MRGKLYILGAILVCIGALIYLELWVRRNIPANNFKSEFKEKIIAEQPDIIFIGNSTLASNVIKSELDAALQAKTGRSIRSTFIARGGMHTSWFYLVLKNQILPSGISNIPLVFVDYDDFFLRPEAKTATGGKSERVIRETLQGNDSIFISKLGPSGKYFQDGWLSLSAKRAEIKRLVVANITMSILRATRVSRLIKTKKFKRMLVPNRIEWLLGTVLHSNNFRTGEATELISRQQLAQIPTSNSDTDKTIFNTYFERSFLPEIIKLGGDFKLVFVLSNSSQHNKQYVNAFSSKLEGYIKDNKATYIDMNRRDELQQDGLMHDNRHFTKGTPRSLNTAALAEEIIKAGVL